MQIECAYCGKKSETIPYCNAPLCKTCCLTCRMVNGACKARGRSDKKAEQPPQQSA